MLYVKYEHAIFFLTIQTALNEFNLVFKADFSMLQFSASKSLDKIQFINKNNTF